jgi:hypothetical protein
MTSRYLPALCALSTILCIGLGVGLVRVVRNLHEARADAARLQEQQAGICRGRMGHLDGIVRELELADRAAPDNPRATSLRHEMSRKVMYGQLDPFILQACVGAPIPVETDAASRCWVSKGDTTSCYLDVAKQLLAVYERHKADW